MVCLVSLKETKMNANKAKYVRLLSLAFVSLITCVATALGANFLWREWLLFAIALSGLYFFGTFRFFPWKTDFSKAFSIGVFVGMLIPVVVFIRGL